MVFLNVICSRGEGLLKVHESEEVKASINARDGEWVLSNVGLGTRRRESRQ